MREQDEPGLVARLKAGDAEAFARVYEAYRGRLFGFLFRLSRRREVAAELLQETWLRLAAEAPWLAGDTRLSAWLFTVARNLFLSHRRWSLLDLTSLAEVALWSVGRSELETPEAAAAAGEARVRLEAAVAALPLKYREALLLVAVEHFEPAEAARIIGISPEAFRQRLSRGRELVRRALEAP